MIKYLCSLGGFAALAVSGALAQDLPEVSVPRAQGPITVDADIQSREWQDAARVPLSEFWTKGEPRETTVSLLYDQEYFYVAFLCEDRQIVSTRSGHDDQTYRDDCVEVFMAAPAERISESVGIEVNPQGTVADFSLRYADWFSYVWESEVKVSTKITEKGYIVEMAIPWRKLLPAIGSPDQPAELRANFGRWDRPDDRFFLWSHSGFPIPYPHQPERYGKLLFKNWTAQP